MSRFNTIAPTTKTVNLAGGEAYSQSSELELISILLTSFANDSFYEKAPDTFKRLKDLIAKVDKKFVAKAAIYARTKYGMRSISHVVAAELAKYIGGEVWAKDFYNSIVYRPDDMLEIASYYNTNCAIGCTNGKKKGLTSAMKKGFATAISNFNAYSLAKYRGEGKGFKLIDLVNLVHPKGTEKSKEALADLVKGQLKSFDTWEVELSKAGQGDGDAIQLKKEAWIKLLSENKLGYFALLRNLRNIINQAPEAIDMALDILTNEDIIKKSLVLPFRFTTAFDEIKQLTNGQIVRKVLVALNKAVDLSLKNVPVFEGDTLVVLDTSGSMTSNGGKPIQIGSLFAAILVKSNNADFMEFNYHAKYKNLNTLDSTITIAESIRAAGGGTNFQDIFTKANRKYQRVIILSDMQGWIGYDSPVHNYNEYKKRTGADPFIYSFDLKGYGTMQFPERNVFCIAGFSDKIFDTMKYMETDKKALLNEIKEVEL